MVIIIAMTKIFLAMALGFFLYKIHILNDDSNSAISKLIIYGCGPAMIFSSVAGVSSGSKSEVGLLIAAGCGAYAVVAVIAHFAAKLLRLPVFWGKAAPLRQAARTLKENTEPLGLSGGGSDTLRRPEAKKSVPGVYEAIMIYGNSAFLGIPIGEALFGSTGTFYMAVLNIHTNVFMFSYGVYQICRGGEAQKTSEGFRFNWKKLLNPGIIAAALALVLYLLDIQVPDFVMQPLDFVGQMTAPVAMLAMGSAIAANPVKNLFTRPRYYFAAFFKLLVFPVIIFALCTLIFGGGNLTDILTMHFAMPTATVVSMLALAYHGDFETSTQATGLMNILCVATIPLIWGLTVIF